MSTVYLMNGKFWNKSFFSMWNIALASTSPHNDFNFHESIFSPLGDLEIPKVVNSNRTVHEMQSLVTKGFEFKDPDCLERGLHCPKYLNPLLVSQLSVRICFVERKN